MEGANIPDFNQLQTFQVNRPGEYEGTRQTLYDFQAYPAAGTTSLNFFQVPQGQSGKTIADTNMETAGTLPAPKHFLVQSIELFFQPADDPVTVNNASDDEDAVVPNYTNDLLKFANGGALDFFIGSKSYLQEAPLGRFPPKTKLRNAFAASLQSRQAVNADSHNQVTMDYSAMDGRPYFINPNILLTPTQNFNVKLEWPTAVAVSGNARVGVVLDGILYRLSQ